jgi:hypothetical protein
MGLEQERAGAVFPKILQRQLRDGRRRDARGALGKRWSHDVAAKSLELGAVVSVNALLGVDADAERFGDWLLFGLAALVLAGGLARSPSEGHAQYRLTRPLAGDGNALSRSLIASKQPGLLETERFSVARGARGGLVVPRAFPALLEKCCMQAPGSAAGDFSDLGRRRSRQLVKAKCALGIAYVNAVEPETMQVDVEPKGTVRALHDRDQSSECKAHALKSEQVLGAALQ